MFRLQVQPGEQPLPLHPRRVPVLLPAQAPDDITRSQTHEEDAGKELRQGSVPGETCAHTHTQKHTHLTTHTHWTTQISLLLYLLLYLWQYSTCFIVYTFSKFLTPFAFKSGFQTSTPLDGLRPFSSLYCSTLTSSGSFLMAFIRLVLHIAPALHVCLSPSAEMCEAFMWTLSVHLPRGSITDNHNCCDTYLSLICHSIIRYSN